MECIQLMRRLQAAFMPVIGTLLGALVWPDSITFHNSCILLQLILRVMCSTGVVVACVT